MFCVDKDLVKLHIRVTLALNFISVSHKGEQDLAKLIRVALVLNFISVATLERANMN
jgi:hypothetical protein